MSMIILDYYSVRQDALHVRPIIEFQRGLLPLVEGNWSEVGLAP